MDDIRVSLGRPDLDALAIRWRAHETAFDASFFQSWSWAGVAARRFRRPVLIEAYRGDQLAGLALFNRRRGRLYLGETGDPALDRVTIEHNGVLAAGGHARAACLRAARRAAWGVVLSGVGADQIAAARDAELACVVTRTMAAPYVDLARLRRQGCAYLAGLSSNARYQLTRSLRRYEALGPVRLARAGHVAEAHAALDALIALHQSDWRARGKPGAFADPAMAAFHHAVIDQGFERGEIDLWHATAGPGTIGYLYNFRHRGRALAYQSGLAREAPEHAKPGLTCHHLAIEAALADGLTAYDFLAGDARYKRTLSNASTELHWASLPVAGSPWWLAGQLRGAASRLGRT